MACVGPFCLGNIQPYSPYYAFHYVKALSHADIATILVAILICLIKPIQRFSTKLEPCFTVRDIVLDFLSGTVIVPFLLLIGSTFSQHLLEEALKSNKVFSL
jgi:hypothetical protein